MRPQGKPRREVTDTKYRDADGAPVNNACYGGFIRGWLVMSWPNSRNIGGMQCPIGSYLADIQVLDSESPGRAQRMMYTQEGWKITQPPDEAMPIALKEGGTLSLATLRRQKHG